MSPGQQQSDTHEVEALSWIIASRAICIWKAVVENNRKQCGAWSHLHREVPDCPPLRDLGVTLVLGMWETAAPGNHGLNLGNGHETKSCLSFNSIPLSLLSKRWMSFFAGWNHSFFNGEPNSTLEILTWSSLWAVGPAEPVLHPSKMACREQY